MCIARSNVMCTVRSNVKDWPSYMCAVCAYRTAYVLLVLGTELRIDWLSRMTNDDNWFPQSAGNVQFQAMESDNKKLTQKIFDQQISNRCSSIMNEIEVKNSLRSDSMPSERNNFRIVPFRCGLGPGKVITRRVARRPRAGTLTSITRPLQKKRCRNRSEAIIGVG